MNYIVKSKIWAAIIALLIAGIFLGLVLTPPSVFNMLPSAIHEAVNPEGEGNSEQVFIITFDVIVALLLLLLSYRMVLNQILKSKQ